MKKSEKISRVINASKREGIRLQAANYKNYLALSLFSDDLNKIEECIEDYSLTSFITERGSEHIHQYHYVMFMFKIN